MPIYEYKCENDHVFDVMQKMSDDPLTACVECGAPVRKVLQPVGISFKGSGFYSTDYNSKKGPKEPAASTNGDSKTETKEKKSTEKPADKPAASSSSSGTKD
ncbi:MAG: zinc ribbon domain-containing protein [Actinomycetota bacterium]|nr:zinc ribbon domain-containing protein [Actinomycetota bacterium]